MVRYIASYVYPEKGKRNERKKKEKEKDEKKKRKNSKLGIDLFPLFFSFPFFFLSFFPHLVVVVVLVLSGT